MSLLTKNMKYRFHIAILLSLSVFSSVYCNDENKTRRYTVLMGKLLVYRSLIYIVVYEFRHWIKKNIYVNVIIPTIFYNYRYEWSSVYNYGLMFYRVLLIDISYRC